MIYPFTYGCARDWDCFTMLIESAEALRDPRLAPWTLYWDTNEPSTLVVQEFIPMTSDMLAFCTDHKVTVRERPHGFAPWTELSAYIKFWGFTDMAKRAQVGDYVAHFDCDTILFSSAILDDIDCGADFVALGCNALDNTGSYKPSMGALQAIRIDTINLRVLLQQDTVESAIAKMDAAGICTWNGDDPVISFIFTTAGGEVRDTSPASKLGLEDALFKGGASFVHYGTGKCSFLGVPDCEKWDFPKVIRKWEKDHKAIQ